MRRLTVKWNLLFLFEWGFPSYTLSKTFNFTNQFRLLLKNGSGNRALETTFVQRINGNCIFNLGKSYPQHISFFICRRSSSECINKLTDIAGRKEKGEKARDHFVEGNHCPTQQLPLTLSLSIWQSKWELIIMLDDKFGQISTESLELSSKGRR